MESSIEFTEKTGAGKTLDTFQRPVAGLSPQVQWGIYRAGLVLVDVLGSLLAFLTAAWVRTNIALPVFNLEAIPTIPNISWVAFGFVPLWLIIFAIHGLYQGRTLLGGTQEYAGVFRAIAIGMLLIVIVGFIQPVSNPARGWTLLAWMFATTYVITGRFILRRVVYSLRRCGYFLNSALIIGNNAEAFLLAEQLRLWQTSGLALQGFIATTAADKDVVGGGLPVLGTIAQLDDVVKKVRAGELILATSALTQDQTLSIFKQYGVSPGINLRLSSGLFEVITTGLEIKEVASVPLLRINQVRLTGVDRVLKTVTDMILSLLIILFAIPVMLVIALVIKLDSPGPVFYRRRVMGINGSQFDALKFRTMKTDGDEILIAHPDLRSELEDTYKLKNDPRVTRVGRILRKHSLDELPQFFNVLRRQMSIVGPRIIAPEEIAKYEQWDINLLTVAPGITGLWQVSGRSDLAYEKRVQLDMRYIRNWSIWLDLHILMRTIIVVFKGDGAY